jgi:hypothetical protein
LRVCYAGRLSCLAGETAASKDQCAVCTQ